MFRGSSSCILTLGLCLVSLAACASDADTPVGGSASVDGSSTGEPTGEEVDTSTSASGGTDDSEGSSEAGDGDGDCIEFEPSEPVEVATEAMTLTSSDAKSLAATLHRPAGDWNCLPAILLVHQFQQDQSQWGEFGSQLAGRGFVVLALDLRGHGMSDPADGALTDLLTDPEQAPRDVEAGVDFLATNPAVDTERISVFGTSIGANLAIAAQHGDPRVAASVALSPRLDPTLELAGSPASLALTNLYCLAGELDGGGDQAQSCNTMGEAATGASQVVVLPGTSAHGVTIFSEFPSEVESAIFWLEGLIG